LAGERLKNGSIYPKTFDDVIFNKLASAWEVYSVKDILKIISIFDSHPLNTSSCFAKQANN